MNNSLAFTMKRLDHLYCNHKQTWDNHIDRERAYDLIRKYENEEPFTDKEIELATILVDLFIDRPEYVPDHMDEVGYD